MGVRGVGRGVEESERKSECGDGWVEIEAESSKWYATERMTCDRQGKQTNKQ